MKCLENGLIKRIHPKDDTKLIQSYNMLVSTCTDYQYLHYNEFLKFKDCIMITEPKGTERYPFAILGIRRVYLHELGIEDLPYHCSKEDAVYFIGFVHYFDPTMGNFEYCKNEVLETMLKAALVDKNDSHCIIYKNVCPETYTNDYLKDCGFNLVESEYVGGEYYIKSPTTY